jgi:4-hydroxy 2-oxovalerate aldolase
MIHPILLDCTLRDGGYYNAWDFPTDLVAAYLAAMKAAQVDVVELGFRGIENKSFVGPCAYTTDEYLNGLQIPEGLQVAVMVNGSELCQASGIGMNEALEQLFPVPAADSPVSLVRLACHYHEFRAAFPAVAWLRKRGYKTGFNLMQIADRTRKEILELALAANDWQPDVLYFADSMGGMSPNDTARIVGWLRQHWSGPLGIHTHDNMGLALQNSLRAFSEGVRWLDATVTGMGRGPGNARTEELLIETEQICGRKLNMAPLMTLIRKFFHPIKNLYGWGTNPYYYLAGKYGIHPTYIQEMLSDARFSEEDILAVIKHLRHEGGKKFSFNSLDAARHFYRGEPKGTWAPASLVAGREVLILGTGPGVGRHRTALESYVRRAKPLVMALNTQCDLETDLIDVRAACHPVRLLADCHAHSLLPQPLITPESMLPEDIKSELQGKQLMDFGMAVERNSFMFQDTSCVIPNSLVVAYALAVAASGRAKRILLAGFDGYPAGDPRNAEMEALVETIRTSGLMPEFWSITPTTYKGLSTKSVYGM